MAAPLTPEAFRERSGVSRETLVRLERYAALLRQWQKAVNLVAPSTLEDLWRRHMLDSAQLFPLLPTPSCRIADLGSGAGFPGLVLAILGAGPVTLLESDGRKCAFLREVIRQTGAGAEVREGRIEAQRLMRFPLIVARALAPLAALLELAEPLLAPGGACLFPKGARVEEELTQAGKAWKMRVERYPSETDSGGCIVRLGEIARVRS